MKLMLFLFLVIASTNACLHSGCNLSGGLRGFEVKEHLKKVLRNTENEGNILRVVSWNLDGKTANWNVKKPNICKQLKTLEVTMFGLQGVTDSQTNDISKCLNEEFQVFKKPSEDSFDILNPIFIKRMGDKIQILQHGTFELSEPPQNNKFDNKKQSRHCTWVKISYGEETYFERKRENFNDKLQRLLGVYTGLRKSGRPAVTSTVIRKNYRYSTVYVANTQLEDANVDKATEQIKTLLWFLKNTVMDRRRYPVVVMGDFGFETNRNVHDVIRKYKWLENTMEFPRRRYPATSYINNDGTTSSKLRDFIFENKYKQILSAVIVDENEEGEHRPVFAALIK